MFRNRTVLVTGAGGSIGSELCHKLMVSHIHKLIALDVSEFNLYKLQEQLLQVPCAEVEYLIADVRDQTQIDRIFEEHKPEVVYHAAALKHVPLLENQHNTLEAFRTNILGTKSVLDAAVEHGSLQFLLVSTDKAVNPLSMMGASKAYAEGYCREVALQQHTTTVVVVRFGNVVGSSGSVTPLWESQIANGGPLTITDTRMVRWFMSIPEAVELVLSASELAEQDYGPTLRTYMLDMGEPVHLIELAHRLMKNMGRQVAIQEIGIRPGEKLVEELRWPYERDCDTSHPKIVQLIAPEHAGSHGFLHEISRIDLACKQRNVDRAKRLVGKRINYKGDLEVI